ncbi:MAG: GNAT family N-acetyltransferase [Ktedonobacteraceae bacterium]
MERAVPNPETCDVLLRDVMMSDLPIFFDQQLDSDANQMAAFTTRDPADRDAFMALSAFLFHVKVRPLYARAAKDNIASLRVLEKCRFTLIGKDKGFSNARGEEVEEFILRLD